MPDDDSRAARLVASVCALVLALYALVVAVG